LKPLDRYEKHSNCGNRYLALRNDIRSFFEIELYTDKSESELKVFLDTLISRKERIKSGETLYETDKDVSK
jgi:hypothetical protein